MHVIFIPFFFNDTATTEFYTLSLHDALPIWLLYAATQHGLYVSTDDGALWQPLNPGLPDVQRLPRSEEHTSELQSHSDLVCRLLLEKKKTELLRAVISEDTNWGADTPHTFHK